MYMSVPALRHRHPHGPECEAPRGVGTILEAWAADYGVSMPLFCETYIGLLKNRMLHLNLQLAKLGFSSH